MVSEHRFSLTNKLHLSVCILLSLGFIVSSRVAVFAQSNSAFAQSQADNEGMTTLEESRPFVARTGAWQTRSDYIHIKPGQDKRKLLLTFINGADGRAKLTDLQVSLARKPLATLKDFDAAGRLSCDLTGKLGVGKTLITVQVFGPSGARLTWKLATPKVTIASVEPNPFTLIDKLTVQGINFSSQIHGIKVFIGNKAAKVVSATSTQLQVQVPSDLAGGGQDMVVSADSIRSNAFKVTVKATPHVQRINLFAGPPGQSVTISGRNFSAIPSENLVTFGNRRAQVISATTNSITCIVPPMDFPIWHLPVVVSTNGMQSKERIFFNADIRVIPH